MKIELKKIEFSERMSDETNCFAADLYLNGIKAGQASNAGRGGPTDYRASSEQGSKLIREAEVYCKQLPPEKFTAGGEEHSLAMSLELYIDKLLEKHLGEKELQKFRNKQHKATLNGIVTGVPDKEFGEWKFHAPLAKILSHPAGVQFITDFIKNKVIPTIKPGERILNTNIPEQVLKDAGLKEHQYITPATDQEKTKQQHTTKRSKKKL